MRRARRVAQHVHLRLGVENCRISRRAPQAGVDVPATALAGGEESPSATYLVTGEEVASGAAATGPEIPAGIATRAMLAATMFAVTRPFRARTTVIGETLGRM